MNTLPRTNQAQKSRPLSRWGTLGLALGAGSAAALLAFLLVRGQRVSGSSAADLVSVVIAAQNIPERTRLTASLLQIRRVPASEAPDGYVAAPAAMVGKVTLHPVAAGKAVLTQSVAVAGIALGMAFSLPPSQRAVTVALDPSDGVEAFARPGDHVDILATDEPGASQAETRTVLQNVTLLAVGSQTSADEAAPVSSSGVGVSRVTVAVSPAQAQAIVLAATRGKLHLALRPANDVSILPLPAFPAPIPAQSGRPAPLPQPRIKVLPKPVAAPQEPLLPLPVTLTPLRPARVTITVIKGSQSQTVTVAP